MKIFICYRREDSIGHTGRLFDRLVQQYGRDHVFMDLDAIAPGEDFAEAIQRRVTACEVELVVIGAGWARAADSAGRRRLEDPDDFVRLEVLTALSRDVRLIPVLVGGAAMPMAADLPEPLRALARRQAFELSDRSFHDGVTRLIASLDAPTPRTPPEPVKTRGVDLRVDLEISFEESLDGTEKELAVEDRRVKLAIPAGVDTGMNLRLQGEGERAAPFPSGDLYVTIAVRESAAFTRDGDNLYCRIDVPAATLKGGGIARTPPVGKRGPLKFAVPPRTRDGACLRLAGKGVPRLKPAGQFGDLFVTVRSV